MAAIRLEHVFKRFGPHEVIHDIDLTIPTGELTVFVGPSGCGKSTVLRLIAGLEEVSAGRIHIGDQEVTELPPARRGIAMVFQSYALYPHMSAFDNMAFGLRLAGQSRAEVAERVRAAARTLQIEPLLTQKPRALSGGQRQRVAIGRAIVREPRAFLFDEPLSNLDATLRVQMRLELARLQQRLQATMVYVTHDQVEAMTLGHTIVVLNQGRVEQVGPPLTLYGHPANRFVAGFIGSPTMNFLPAHVRHPGAKGVTVSLTDGTELAIPGSAAGPPPGTAVTVGLRPEHLAPSESGIRGRITLVERLGSEAYLYLDTPCGPLTVRSDDAGALGPGDMLTVSAPLAKRHLFLETGEAVPPP